MSKFVTDTTALVLFLEGRRLPQQVKTCFSSAISGADEVVIPAVTLAEIGYLSEKGRIVTTLQDVANLLANHSTFSVLELDMPTIQAAFKIKDVPELHDRLIAGAALHFNLPLLTNDPAIAKSVWISTIWV